MGALAPMVPGKFMSGFIRAVKPGGASGGLSVRGKTAFRINRFDMHPRVRDRQKG